MNNKELAQKVVDRMLDIINQDGTLPWIKPWKGNREIQILDGWTEITVTPRFWNRQGKPYQGVNNLLLSLSGKEGEFLTFKQCQSEGGRVKKGAKASTIIYWSQYVKETEELDSDGKKIKKVIPVLREYKVFHASDCEGIKAKHKPAPEVIRVPQYHYEPVNGTEAAELKPEAESVIHDYIDREKTLTLIRDEHSDRAYYSPALDSVTVPRAGQFDDIAEYYSTMFHELGHSTGHETRLNRFTGKAKNAAFGSEEYSKEELVAEITSATLLNMLGMESGNSFRNSTAYVKSWAAHIKSDPMMFITASSKADKAVNYIMGLKEEEVKDNA